ncbi:MAG: YjbH domain-containing protein [bacterium]|jgi:hypothetical protein
MKKFALVAVLFAVIGAVCAPRPAQAKITELNQIPTADVIGVAKFRINFDVSFTGGENTIGSITEDGTGFLLGATAGVFPKLEVGVTVPFEEFDIGAGFWPEAPSQTDAQFEFKFNVIEESLTMPGVSVGMRNIASDADANYFVVVSKHFTELVGLHAGAQGNTFGMDDDIQFFAGANAKVIPGMLELMADWQNNDGDELDQGVFGLGVKWQGFPMFDIIAKGFFVDGDNNPFDNLYVVEVAWNSI